MVRSMAAKLISQLRRRACALLASDCLNARIWLRSIGPDTMRLCCSSDRSHLALRTKGRHRDPDRVMPAVSRRLRILVLSWNYPTAAAPLRGLWVERMCNSAAQEADIRVIVPTPLVPPFVPVESLARFRRIPPQEQRAGIEIYYPRVAGSIEYHTHGFDAQLAVHHLIAF